MIAPVLTGGVWIKRPGLFLEISDPGIPVLLLTCLGGIFYRFFQTPLQLSSSARISLRVFRGWQNHLALTPKRTLFLSSLVMGILAAFASLRRHWAFESHSYDLGIFTNVLWNLTHGFGYISSIRAGMNLFADHQAPTFWLLGPLFSIFPAPETLLILQAAAWATGGISLYYFARKILEKNHWFLAALPWIYWSYLPLRNAILFDFHPEALMPPLFFAATLFLQSRKIAQILLGAVFFILALGTKESAGPVAVGIGLSWLLGAWPKTSQTQGRRTGLFAVILGLAVFAFDLNVAPHFFHSTYLYKKAYIQFGDNLSDIFFAPITHPILVLKQILGWNRWVYFWKLTAPLGLFPVSYLPGLLAALPGFLMLFLGQARLSLSYHYAIEPSLALFLFLPIAFNRLSLKISSKNSTFLVLWTLFWSLGMSGRSEVQKIREFSPTPHQKWITDQLLPCIDSKKSLIATDPLVPHLSSRHWIEEESGPLSTPQGPIECWLYDDAFSHWPITAAEAQEKASRNFLEVFRCGSTRVFAKSQGVNCMACTPQCSAIDQQETGISP